jgi:phosphoenolpyruvate carboxykinase (GTP)
VNWFRKDEEGSFLWPGFGDNARVLKWVLERVAGEGDAVDTPIGRVPAPSALDLTGLELSPDDAAKLVAVDEDEWRDELPRIEAHYADIGDRLPQELRDELADLEKRLAS